MKEDKPYLTHILEAISKIEEYTQRLGKKQFKSNTLIQDAVIRQIEIIGEATKQLSHKTRNKNPEIPWKDITGMRDKLIHQYFGVDIDAVWTTIKKDLPTLKKQIQKTIKD